MAKGSPQISAPGAKPNRPAARPIDLEHLAKQCLGDEHLEYEVLRLFDTTVKTYLARLELAKSVDDVIINLHSLRGASGGVGAWAIADLAKQAEDCVRAGQPMAPEQVADIGIAVEEVRAFIAERLRNEPV